MAEPNDATWRQKMFENYVFSLARIAELGPAAASEHVGPWLCIDAGLGKSSFNIAVLLQAPANPVAALEQVEAWYSARGINPRLDLRIDEDAEVISAAALGAFEPWWSEPALLLHPLPDDWHSPPGFEWRRVESEPEIDTYARLDSEEYGDWAFQAAMAQTAVALPGCDLVIGFMNGEPAARSMAVTTGDLTGVHNVYVPPSMRRRGLGAAITAAAIEVARRRGAVAACLEATPLGRPVYERMGFRKLNEYVVLGKDRPRE